MTRRRSTTGALLIALATSLIAPAAAQAACDATARADIADAVSVVRAMRESDAPGVDDAAAVLARARRSCADARFARAVARTTSRLGLATPGRHVRAVGMDLLGTSAGTWRFDAVRTATRLSAATTESGATALRAQLRADGFGTGAIVWSDDPTLQSWDPARQSSVAVLLLRSEHPIDHVLAGASVRAFAGGGRTDALSTRTLVEHLRIANRLAAVADDVARADVRSASHAVAGAAYMRLRAAQMRSWTKIDGVWSTATVHRLIATQAKALLAREPDPSTTAAVTKLTASLTASPTLRFASLPTGEFYPAPRDGAFDTASLAIDPDKPVHAIISIYALNGDSVVRALEQDLVPGETSFAWDGASSTGTTLGAGDYRYNIDLVDLLGNRARVPGLQQFRIAVDTVAPTVTSATVRQFVSGGVRRLVVAWDVTEVHSPQVHSTLVLQQGSTRQVVELHDSLQKATVRRVVTLARGQWQATFVFVDGSGNRATKDAGTLVVR